MEVRGIGRASRRLPPARADHRLAVRLARLLAEHRGGVRFPRETEAVQSRDGYTKKSPFGDSLVEVRGIEPRSRLERRQSSTSLFGQEVYEAVKAAESIRGSVPESSRAGRSSGKTRPSSLMYDTLARAMRGRAEDGSQRP